jgi:hypothetical protein
MTTRRAIRDYHEPAGGWGALKAVAALTEQDTAIKGVYVPPTHKKASTVTWFQRVSSTRPRSSVADQEPSFYLHSNSRPHPSNTSQRIAISWSLIRASAMTRFPEGEAFLNPRFPSTLVNPLDGQRAAAGSRILVREMFSLQSSNQMVEGSVCIGLWVCARPAKWRA